jgi:hypothetical protein
MQLSWFVYLRSCYCSYCGLDRLNVTDSQISQKQLNQPEQRMADALPYQSHAANMITGIVIQGIARIQNINKKFQNKMDKGL